METQGNATDETLLKSQRHERILAMLKRSGQVHAGALGELFKVSAYTIRRDLDELADAGALQRVHGGAVLASHVPKSYEEREGSGIGEKKQSALAALALVAEDDVVIIDGGSTTAALVRALPAGYPATFITHSPAIADELLHRSVRETILIGGRLDPHSRVAVGALPVETYGRISADICFLGIWGLNITQGVTSPYYDEAQVRAAMVGAANRVVGLAVANKLGTGGPFTVAPASALTHLSVEGGVPEEVTRPFEEIGIRILSPGPEA
ncbi:DeoR/GlpR family DNA-binding transcription regulator [Streptomyces sp. SID8352]|uniref:DeoR/GlpR family DNA-binding transcription regulator n=1 Tax=unclassified Streptomyces TaxID=2593676 RepID=UPI00137034F3|nr:DeoR/GlpR family DNA-binding transcription regulator [Streptomyces sp. SID8352]MYU22663.1 DeoR family transcriptional regulator [Streptomyces sp. SID8352]